MADLTKLQIQRLEVRRASANKCRAREGLPPRSLGEFETWYRADCVASGASLSFLDVDQDDESVAIDESQLFRSLNKARGQNPSAERRAVEALDSEAADPFAKLNRVSHE